MFETHVYAQPISANLFNSVAAKLQNYFGQVVVAEKPVKSETPLTTVYISRSKRDIMVVKRNKASRARTPDDGNQLRQSMFKTKQNKTKKRRI